MANDGVGPILQGKIAGVGKVPRLRDGTGVRVHGGTPPDPAWLGAGPSVGRRPAATSGPADVQGLLPKDDRVSGMPSRGLQGRGGDE